VTKDEFWFLRDGTRAVKSPMTPPQMHNHGNFIVSLGALCVWLAPQAEALGVEIYPGFAAAEPLFDDNGGHAMFFTAFDGTRKMCIHQPERYPLERAMILDVEETADGLKVKTQR
jgi:hypothetical protein